MFELVVVAVLVVALFVGVRIFGTGGLSAAVKQAKTSGEPAPIVEFIERSPAKKHPNLWDQAIGTLWQDYERELALMVMVAAATRSEAPVVQFWLKNAMEVEPKMAREAFGDEFLEEYFRPRVAAKCGRVSCCM